METFRLAEGVEVLSRTPEVLDTWLGGLPDAWLRVDEGPGTWSPYQIVGHLVHGERTDWIPRVRHLLEHGPERPFVPFDREAMLRDDASRPIGALLDEFADLRRLSLVELHGLDLTDQDWGRPGLHPALGEVTLGQLLATWVAHDLTHVSQIARVMAKRYRADVGPWRAYLPLLDRPTGGS